MFHYLKVKVRRSTLASPASPLFACNQPHVKPNINIMSSSHPLFESHPYAQSYPTHLSPRLPPSAASVPDQHSPQFRPLPIDHSAPNTPPHAYTMSTDPMDSYSSYNNASIASPYKSSLGPSDPLSFPPPPINTASKSRWNQFWSTYKSKNQVRQ